MAEDKSSYALRLVSYFLQYSPVVDMGSSREVVYGQGGRKVIVRNPLGEIYPWKVFLYMLWKGKEFREGERYVEVEVDLKQVRGLLRKPRLSILDIALELGGIRDVEYVVLERKENRYQVSMFRIFPGMEIVEEVIRGKSSGTVKLYVDREFFELCRTMGLFMYMGFVEEIRSVYTFNLCMFLSSRQDGKFREDVLLEKSGLGRKENYTLAEKRRLLKKALDELVRIDFIAGWIKADENYHVERHPQERLRLLALEKAQKLNQDIEAFWQKVREKDRILKQLQRKKKKEIGF